jgi:hypothetical protein
MVMSPTATKRDRIKGLGSKSPPQRRSVPCGQEAGKKVIALPVMGGLHYDYHWAAWSETMRANIQLVDELHHARRVMPEKVFGRPLIEPLHTFSDDLLSIHLSFHW